MLVEDAATYQKTIGTYTQSSVKGERLDQDLANHWEVTNKLSVCRKDNSNITQTHNQVSNLLGLSVTSIESKFLLKANASKIKLRERERESADT